MRACLTTIRCACCTSTLPHRGYTDRLDRALFDEPEAISADAQQQITERSHRDADALLLGE